MVSDVQVSRESEAQVSASMVLESRAKKRRVPTHQQGSQDLGGSRVTLKSHSILRVSRTTKIKISPKETQNHEKLDPGIIGTPTSAKIDFCHTSLAKCLVFQSWTSTFKPKNHSQKEAWKQA